MNGNHSTEDGEVYLPRDTSSRTGKLLPKSNESPTAASSKKCQPDSGDHTDTDEYIKNVVHGILKQKQSINKGCDCVSDKIMANAYKKNEKTFLSSRIPGGQPNGSRRKINKTEDQKKSSRNRTKLYKTSSKCRNYILLRTYKFL